MWAHVCDFEHPKSPVNDALNGGTEYEEFEEGVTSVRYGTVA